MILSQSTTGKGGGAGREAGERAVQDHKRSSTQAIKVRCPRAEQSPWRAQPLSNTTERENMVRAAAAAGENEANATCKADGQTDERPEMFWAHHPQHETTRQQAAPEHSQQTENVEERN